MWELMESPKRNPGRRRATVGLVDEGEGAEAHKAFVKVERMTMDAVMMALSLLVLLTLMAVARTHEVDGRRMLQESARCLAVEYVQHRDMLPTWQLARRIGSAL